MRLVYTLFPIGGSHIVLTSIQLFDSFCVTLTLPKMLRSLAIKLIYHILQYMNIFETKKILNQSWPIRADLHDMARPVNKEELGSMWRYKD